MGSRFVDSGLAADPKRSPVRRATPRREGATAAKVKEPLRSPGRPLPAGPRAAMESRFGHDFSRIRIHDDSAAASASEAMNARAYTVGDDLVFGAGEFAPERPGGAHLLAHELAHAVQHEEAGAVDADRLDASGDAPEREAADAADAVLTGSRPRLSHASQPGGAAAVGRQPKDTSPGATVPREIVRDRLKAYLETELAAQGGPKLKLTGTLLRNIDGLFDADSSGHASLRFFLLSNVDARFTPQELASKVAAYLPAQVTAAHAASIGAVTGPPATGPTEPTRIDRLVDLVQRSKPADLPPEQQEAGWRFDQNAKDLRRNDPSVVGPYSLPDVFTIGRVLQGLPEALKGPAPKRVEPESYASVDKAIASIDPKAFMPHAVGAGASTDSWANAQDAARGLAAALDVGQKKKQYDVTFRLGANYQSFPDKAALYAAFRDMVAAIRDALPHHASDVSGVWLYFGDKPALRVPLH
jgi:hypothetical protein